MARLRAERHAEGGSAGRRKTSRSAGGRKSSRPANGRKTSGSAGGRKSSRPATGPEKSRPATGPKKGRRESAWSPSSVLLTAVAVLVGMGVLVLAGWLLTFPLNDVRYTSGLAGTPGTFTAARCHTTGAGKGSTRICTGTFVSAKGGFIDRTAQVRNARIDVGRPAALRRRPDGGYVQPSPVNAGMNLATAFGIVSLAAFLLVVLCVSPKQISVGGWKRLRENPPPWGMLLSILVPLFGASLVLAGLCALVGFLLSLVF
jgi:hypothetical protein